MRKPPETGAFSCPAEIPERLASTEKYTDALWTSLTPIFGLGAYFVFGNWLEIPRNYSFYAACVLAGLMSIQVIVQTYRSNGISLFFLLSLFAKIALLSLYFLMMAFLLFGAVRRKI